MTKTQNTELNRLMKKEFHRDFGAKSEEYVRNYLMERFEECKIQVLQTHPGKPTKVARNTLYHEDASVLMLKKSGNICWGRIIQLPTSEQKQQALSRRRQAFLPV